MSAKIELPLPDGWRLTHTEGSSWLWLYKQLPNGWQPGVFDIGSHRPTRYRVFAVKEEQMVNGEMFYENFDIAKTEAIRFAMGQPVTSNV